MAGVNKNKRYLLWLAVGTGVLALAMAVLLALQVMQQRAIQKANELRVDSIASLVFQFEREFLRLRQTLEAEVLRAGAPDTAAIQLRYDLFLSRLHLLRDNPTTDLIAHRSEYRKVMPRMDPLVAQADAALGATNPDKAALRALLAELNQLGQDMQALSMSATSEISALVESQEQALMEQNQQIIWLALGQLIFLLLAAVALALRQRRMEQERRALEELTHELREAQYRAESANRGKSQFLANMSHELRTPFNGMLGMMSLMEATPLSAEQSDYLVTAKGSAQHLLTLLNDILDVSALESGKITLKPAPVNLRALLSEVQALMQPLAAERQLGFALVLECDTPWVLADATRLKQILFNLVNNAIKFTERGQVTLTVNPQASHEGAPCMSFAVQDTGIGMDAQALSRLFQRFYQADGGLARKTGGTGLGLEISQTMARMMGGSIVVSSVAQQGSTFTVRLPLSTCEAPASSAEPATLTTHAPQPATARNTGPERAPLRVLVAEDHPVNRKFVAILLSKMGCEATFCENGQLAVEVAGREVFDLVLMDIHMPVMDGLTATRTLRAMAGPMGRVPVIALTADVVTDAREQALAAGVNGFITKPVQIGELQAAIKACLPDAFAPTGASDPATQA